MFLENGLDDDIQKPLNSVKIWKVLDRAAEKQSAPEERSCFTEYKEVYITLKFM